MYSKLPRGLHVPSENKKTGHRTEVKHTAAVCAPPNAAGVLKPHNVPRKNAPQVYKGVSSRLDIQAELKEQNQHLIAANELLQKNLTDSQQRVSKLEQQFSDLETKNLELEKNMKDCHILLLDAKIDPVSGESVGEAARQNEEQRKEVMSVSTDLLNELKAFGDVVSQQQLRLQEIQKTITDVTGARELLSQERKNFSLDAAEMENTLKEAEALLL